MGLDNQAKLRKQVPPTHSLFEPCLEAISALGGSATSVEVAAKVGDMLSLSVEVQQVELANAVRPVLSYRIAWALNGLKLYGAVTRNKRQWNLTDVGRNMPVEGRQKMIVLALSKQSKLARVQKQANN